MKWTSAEKTLVGSSFTSRIYRDHLINILLVFGAFVFYITSKLVFPEMVLGAFTESPQPVSDYLVSETTISAKSSFEQKIFTITEEIPFEINYRDDPEMEYGEEKVLEPGVNGAEKTNYLVTYWFGEETDRELVGTEIVAPISELTAKGTKIVWREIETDEGALKYWRKLHVWATKYDGNCDGCRGLTYSGTPVRKGVCAVDPKVISLGTNFYVEGYGMCRSEDIGGGIKGNMVDLGYEDVSKGEWRTGYTNVYLLTSAPED